MTDTECKKPKMSSSLDQLKSMTTIVADSGDFEILGKFSPTDVTTNPSLILAAAFQKKYAHVIDKAVRFGKQTSSLRNEQLEAAMDYTCVFFGAEILKIIPGRLSVEIDARLSFDKDASVVKARKLISIYEEVGISKNRILIKLASTWEGIQAARELEKIHDIRCNLTLVFSFAQAVACAEAAVTLVSPFVGRIYDWHILNSNQKTYDEKDDPGITFVKKVYNYYKVHNYKTSVMGASFRNISQVKALAGCDLLTIGPTLLEELNASTEIVPEILSITKAKEHYIEKVTFNETLFRWYLNEDKMATEKLSEGIRKFAVDVEKLEQFLEEKL